MEGDVSAGLLLMCHHISLPADIPVPLKPTSPVHKELDAFQDSECFCNSGRFDTRLCALCYPTIMMLFTRKGCCQIIFICFHIALREKTDTRHHTHTGHDPDLMLLMKISVRDPSSSECWCIQLKRLEVQPQTIPRD